MKSVETKLGGGLASPTMCEREAGEECEDEAGRYSCRLRQEQVLIIQSDTSWDVKHFEYTNLSSSR